MKKMGRVMIIGTMICAIAMGTVGCSSEDTKLGRSITNAVDSSDVIYQASTRFLYSQDGGKSWSETIQEVPVNETYYLAIEMQVSQSEETNDEKTVVATVTIPSTDVLDCYLDDHPGVSITGKIDALTNSISYDFDIVAGVTPQKFRVVFECKPIAEGRASVEVVYDDMVSDSWDASGTIKYVSVDNVEAE